MRNAFTRGGPCTARGGWHAARAAASLSNSQPRRRRPRRLAGRGGGWGEAAVISSPALSRSYTGGSLLQEAAWVQWGHPKKPWGVWGGVMRTPPPQCWCPPWGEGSPAALIAAARPHAGRHRCFFGTAVLLARGRGQQSPADAMQQQCVCMGGGGGTKHPNASLTPPPSPSHSCLIPLPRAAPEFPGCHELPVLSPGGLRVWLPRARQG